MKIKIGDKVKITSDVLMHYNYLGIVTNELSNDWYMIKINNARKSKIPYMIGEFIKLTDDEWIMEML